MSQHSVAEKRERLFNLYSANFKAFFPDYDDMFMCPLCSRGYGRDALQHDGILTLEHCISSKLGGTLETLTCGECNNSHGSIFDAHLVNKHRNEDSMLGLSGRPMKGEIKVGEATVQARVTIESEPAKIEIQFVQKATHPDAVRAAIREIEEKGKIPNGLEFNLSWSMGYTQRRYEVGLLRSAFLTLFSYFGYRYSHRKSSQIMREQICNPDEVVLPADYIVPLNDDFPASNCLTVVVRPAELRAFLVPIKSASDHWPAPRRQAHLV